MPPKWCVASSLALFTIFCAAAEEPIEPEELRIETEIAPGENLFVVSPSWGGASSVWVFSADDLTYKGNVAAGMTPQFALNTDNATGYMVSAFSERFTYGPVTSIFQAFDVKTLQFSQDIPLPPKLAQTIPQASALTISADGQWAFIQNATPATSVSVVNLTSGELASEIPNPGCWGIYPASSGANYSSICGNGAMISYVLDEAGQLSTQSASDMFFDVEVSPVFIHPQRDGNSLYFVTYDGTLLQLDDGHETPALAQEWAFTAGIEGDWAPGGYEVTAYNAANKVLFVLMHSGARDGSHKNGAEEIWALDVQNRKVLSRSESEAMTHITVTQDKDAPVLFGTNGHESGLYRYEITPEAKFAATLTASRELAGAGYLLAEH